jgi:hypothetical protein
MYAVVGGAPVTSGIAIFQQLPEASAIVSVGAPPTVNTHLFKD